MRPLWLAAGVFIIATLPAQASETIGYSYDALGRLVGVSHAGSANNGLSSTIAYDPADNRTSYVTTGAASAPTLSVGDASAARGGALQFTVSRSGSAGGAISVAYATADGTAKAGTDYTAASGTLGFAAGEMSKTVSVATSSNVVADDRTLTLALSSPSAGVTLGRGTATGTIKGNPPPPVSFAIGNAAPVTEGGTLVFTVTRTGTTSAALSVNYATADGTAKAGSRYNVTSGTLTFAPSDTSKTIGVATINDSVVEPPQTVLVTLSSPTGGATISTGQASGTINDDDVAPIVALNPRLDYNQSTTNVVAIGTLATLNGRPATIASFGVPSGNGRATIAGNGQSVSYSAPVVGKGPPCEPAPVLVFNATYSIRDSGTGSVTSGSSVVIVRGLPGGRPRTGVCP